MGNVAFIAGAYLVEVLQPRQVLVFDPGDHFDIGAVEVKDGVIEAPRMPRNTLFRWDNPSGRHLLVLVGEAQPSGGAYGFCEKVVEVALEHRVSRIVTFAASPAELEPDASPGILAVANHEALLPDLEAQGIPVMSEGRITGMNGVFLGAAAVRGLRGLCLLGEIPFYAVPFPNPGTSLVLLEAFSRLSGVPIPLEALGQRVESARETIETVYRSMQEAALASHTQEEYEDDEDEGEDGEEAGTEEPGIPADAVRRIEDLFREATEDRARAVELKQELDRWGVFKKYEDRFLDLFKKSGSS